MTFDANKFKLGLATLLQVAVDRIDLNISAGSVRVHSTIRLASGAEGALNMLESALSNQSAAISDLLGHVVEAWEPPELMQLIVVKAGEGTSPTPPWPPQSHEQMPEAQANSFQPEVEMIAGVAVGGAATGCIFSFSCVILVLLCQTRKRRARIGVMPNSVVSSHVAPSHAMPNRVAPSRVAASRVAANNVVPSHAPAPRRMLTARVRYAVTDGSNGGAVDAVAAKKVAGGATRVRGDADADLSWRPPLYLQPPVPPKPATRQLEPLHRPAPALPTEATMRKARQHKPLNKQPCQPRASPVAVDQA